MNDSLRHQGLRKKLVEGLKLKGIRNQKVLDAIGKVPRHLFMESSFINFAYKDQAFPIGSGQTISQPYTVAFQTQLLDVQKHDKILEVGTGSGYQAAVLLELEANVLPSRGKNNCMFRFNDCFLNWAIPQNSFSVTGIKGCQPMGLLIKYLLLQGHLIFLTI